VQLDGVADPRSKVCLFCGHEWHHIASPTKSLYFPSAQTRHEGYVASQPQYPALHEQSVSKPLPAGETMFVGHGTQEALETAPRSGEYVPVSHAMHAGPLLACRYLPGPHFVHVPVDPSAVPGTQTQTEFDRAPVMFEELKSGHGVHEADPMFPLYLAGSHAAHDTVPSLPVYPARQRHVTLPSRDVVVCGHEVQVELDVAPSPCE